MSLPVRHGREGLAVTVAVWKIASVLGASVLGSILPLDKPLELLVKAFQERLASESTLVRVGWVKETSRRAHRHGDNVST